MKKRLKKIETRDKKKSKRVTESHSTKTDRKKPQNLSNSGKQESNKVSKNRGNSKDNKVSSTLATGIGNKVLNKVSKQQEQLQVEEFTSIHKGIEVVGQTEKFVLVRFPKNTSGEWLYHVVDKLQAFVWSMAFNEEEAMQRLKYIDHKYGLVDNVFHKNLDLLVSSDYHIKCTLNGRNALKDLFEKTDFDKVPFHSFPVEKAVKREKRVIKWKETKKEKKQEKPVEDKKEKRTIKKRSKRQETVEIEVLTLKPNKEKRKEKKRLRKRK